MTTPYVPGENAYGPLTIDDLLIWLDALKRHYGGQLTLSLEDGRTIEDARVVRGVIVLYTHRAPKERV